jgi:NTP pyrophosphatase (non-canonical NTP hydrolase)
MKTFEDLRQDTLLWGNKRDLLHSSNASKQFMKLIEEVGELSRAILKDDNDKIVDGIGDSLVCIIILAEQLGYNPVKCLNSAYEEIKNREGETVDGVFIKND